MDDIINIIHKEFQSVSTETIKRIFENEGSGNVMRTMQILELNEYEKVNKETSDNAYDNCEQYFHAKPIRINNVMRFDLRTYNVMTIDSHQTKTFDDAIHINVYENIVEIAVHCPDPTEVSRELPRRESLSLELGKDILSYTFMFYMNKETKQLLDFFYFPSIIKMKAQLTYDLFNLFTTMNSDVLIRNNIGLEHLNGITIKKASHCCKSLFKYSLKLVRYLQIPHTVNKFNGSCIIDSIGCYCDNVIGSLLHNRYGDFATVEFVHENFIFSLTH